MVIVHSKQARRRSAATAAASASRRSSSQPSTTIAGWRESTSVLSSCTLLGHAAADGVRPAAEAVGAGGGNEARGGEAVKSFEGVGTVGGRLEQRGAAMPLI